MFRNILSALVAAAFLATLAARVSAADEVKCEGKIVRIDGDAIAVLQATTKEQQMKIEPATKITSGGKPVNPIDLKIGQQVKCMCDRHGEELICTTMEIMRDTP